MTSPAPTSETRPEPPLDPDVFLGGFDRIDVPIDWLAEDWALGFSAAGLGALFRLFAASLRQSPAGSLPGAVPLIRALVPGDLPPDALDEALALWREHSDGRRYWSRILPSIEAAWGRRRGKTSKEAERKRRERLKAMLVRCGLTEIGAANRDVQEAVLAEMPEGGQTRFDVVFEAAQRAGVIGGPVRTIRGGGGVT